MPASVNDANAGIDVFRWRAILAFANVAADHKPQRLVGFEQRCLEGGRLQVCGPAAIVVTKRLNPQYPLPFPLAIKKIRKPARGRKWNVLPGRGKRIRFDCVFAGVGSRFNKDEFIREIPVGIGPHRAIRKGRPHPRAMGFGRGRASGTHIPDPDARFSERPTVIL